MRKILWISRHAMTADAKADLALRMQEYDIEIDQRNITWQATVSGAEDRYANRAIWQTLIDEASAEADKHGVGRLFIAGVFPPVALEAIGQKSERPTRLRILTPVSEQAPELRVGDGPIPFRHVRWLGL